MLHYGPFKGVENAWDDDDFARFLAHLVGNGVYPNPSTGLQVIQNENMTVVVKPGAAWINGRFLYSDGDIVLNFDNADGVLKRIDRVIIRLNHVERKIEIAIKKGTFASSPVALALQRDADMYELALADVLINNGATAITQANITDQRLNNELCGIVHGTVDQVDTATIFNQYQSWYEQMTGQKLNEYDAWFAQHQQEFNDWFITIQDILDGNVAGNLLTLIQQNESDIKSLNKIKRDVTILKTGWVFNPTLELFEYTITDVDIFEDSIVDVNIHLEYLEKAKLLKSVCKSLNGSSLLYSDDTLEDDLIVDYKITRQVV